MEEIDTNVKAAIQSMLTYYQRHGSDGTWALRHLRSSVVWLFVQQISDVNNKEIIKAPALLPYC